MAGTDRARWALAVELRWGGAPLASELFSGPREIRVGPDPEADFTLPGAQVGPGFVLAKLGERDGETGGPRRWWPMGGVLRALLALSEESFSVGDGPYRARLAGDRTAPRGAWDLGNGGGLGGDLDLQSAGRRCPPGRPRGDLPLPLPVPLTGAPCALRRLPLWSPAMATGRGDRIVWLDMEMTGLDPERDKILEVAVLVTDGQLRLVAEGPDLVVHQPDEILAGMDDWNTRHHTSSGLVDKVKASTLDEAAADQQIVAFLAEHCDPGKSPLAGNSIHQDRRFIRRGMPALDRFLHYRMIDVSSVKELVKRWMPEVHASAPPKNDVHRALDDIRESLAELAHYRAHAFRPHPGSDPGQP